MSGNGPDYDLDDVFEMTRPDQLRAMGHPLRTAVLGLLHERAASVTELASALERPKSTVAYHVNVLADAGLIRVVRTRRVKAIDERFYGRTARMIYAGVGDEGDLPLDFNDFAVAARESAAAYEDRELWAFIRHARLTEEQAGEFWRRIASLVDEFDRLPRSGDTVYGFAAGIYPAHDHPKLPPAG
jgi:DNA-binding transcriptional ArsR family regulator